MAPNCAPLWHDLLEVARWTPSPHNTQPWKLLPIDERTAALYTDPARTLPDEDTTGCFIRCAMGMFEESLAIVASHRGFTLEIGPPAPPPPRNTLIPFSTLSLTPTTAAPDTFAPNDIINRRTSRLPPDPTSLSDDELRPLAELAARYSQRFFWSSDLNKVASIMDANMQAVCHDLNDPPYHDEIVRWLRYGRRHALKSHDGLDSSCMNMPAHELYLTARLPGLLTAPLIGPLMRTLYSRRLGRVPQLGFLAGDFFNPPHAAPNAGRALMRLWLAMHRQGIGIHPFGNLVTNAAAHRVVSEITGINNIWLVFRMGKTATPPRSLRLSVENLLCSKP